MPYINSQSILPTPSKIVSLVPSQTELLHSLGLEHEVIGITKFCVHPTHWYRQKTRIGGTKTVNIDTIHLLKPDLIIANKEENIKEQVDELAMHYPVWVSEVSDFNSAIQMIHDIGMICGKYEQATTLIDEIKNNKKEFEKSIDKNHIKSALYLIWKDPYMAAGNDTYIHHMMQIAGFKNCISTPRYPTLNELDLQELNPAYILLSSEPYPFKEKHIIELQNILPHSKIILVDGEYFSWYGSRMLKAFDYFRSLHEQTLA